MTTPEPNALVPAKQAVTRVQQRDLMEFSTIADAMKFAEMIQHAEGAIPKHCLGKPGKILATIMAGHELGVGPMASLRAFHVVEGKPTADYSFWIARLKQAGYRVEFPVKTDEKVTLALTNPDGVTHTETWDKARAVKAGLWGRNTWAVHPQTMLTARCVTSAGRAFAAEVMYGCYDTDEAEEIIREADATVREPEPQLTAARLAAAQGDAAVDAEQQETERRARVVHAELKKGNKALADSLLAEVGAKGKRISELPREQLNALAAKLGIPFDVPATPSRDELLRTLAETIEGEGLDPVTLSGWAKERTGCDDVAQMTDSQLAEFVAWLASPPEKQQ